MATKIFKDNEVILDDEKYFTFSNSNTPGNRGYYTDNKATAPTDIRFNMVEKYPPKVLVYMVISSRGISEIHAQECGNAIDADTYINKCLNKTIK